MFANTCNSKFSQQWKHVLGRRGHSTVMVWLRSKFSQQWKHVLGRRSSIAGKAGHFFANTSFQNYMERIST